MDYRETLKGSHGIRSHNSDGMGSAQQPVRVVVGVGSLADHGLIVSAVWHWLSRGRVRAHDLLGPFCHSRARARRPRRAACRVRSPNARVCAGRLRGCSN